MNARLLEAAIHPLRERRHERLDKGVAMIVVLLIGCALFASWMSPIRCVWFAIAAVIMSSYVAAVSKRDCLRALWVNIAVISFALGVIEGYFGIQGPPERQMDYTEEFFIADDVLGYKPAAARRIGHRSYGGDRLLYDVTYTLDAHGLRIASPPVSEGEAPLPCVAFFGDSFTFGEGMADEQTMPYQVWKRLTPHFQTVNFGFLGYGPHQMLAALEQGRVSDGHCRATHIVYQAIPSHVSRAAGLEAWDHHGPRYGWLPGGVVRQEGHFDDLRPTTALQWLRYGHRMLHVRMQAWLEASALYRTLLNSHRPVTPEDVALFAAIVNTAKQAATRIYPGVTFQVLFWDYDDDAEVGEQILSQLAAQGIAVHPMSTILPGFPAARARYEISPYDRHPNEQAHARIADFVAQRLVQPSASHMSPSLLVLQQ
jgi:hypothetical protein